MSIAENGSMGVCGVSGNRRYVLRVRKTMRRFKVIGLNFDGSQLGKRAINYDGQRRDRPWADLIKM